jgi:predicted acyltransferase (DUF342 family)
MLALIFITVTLFIVPFLPALIEWKQKTDSGPLNVVFYDQTLVDYVLRMFYSYLKNNFSRFFDADPLQYEPTSGILDHKVHYQISKIQGLLELSKSEQINKKSDKVFLLCESTTMPEGVIFTNKVYAKKSLSSGVKNTFNEVVAETDLLLNAGTVIQRMAYSNTQVTVGQDCDFNGYLRAKKEIHFLGNAKFQYIYAPYICFGTVTATAPLFAVDIISEVIPRILKKIPFVIRDNSHLAASYVAKRSMIIGEHCSLRGSIKSYGRLQIKDNTSIMGAIICENDIEIGDNCFVQGPIISTKTLRIGKNCVMGSKDTATSIIANHIFISPGCAVFGLLLAKVEGVLQERPS